jgi:hypothetical protein
MNLPPQIRSGRGWSAGFTLWRKHKLKLELQRKLKRARQRGFLEVDMMVGLAILTIAVLPLGYTFVRERQVLKIEYCRCVADEIVDGEMEILLAGAGKNLPDGPQAYVVNARAASQLPHGHFQLTKTGNHLRLEWTPEVRRGFAAVVREGTLK